MNNQIYLELIFLLGSPVCLQGQSESLYPVKQLLRGNDTLRSRLLLPEDFNNDRRYPLILVVHRAGERGNSVNCRGMISQG